MTLGLQWLLYFNGGLVVVWLLEMLAVRLKARARRNSATRPGWRASL
jgi:hypothetical protein